MHAVFKWLLLVFILACTTSCQRIVRSIAGVPPFGGDNKLAINARFLEPHAIFITSKNEVYLSDTRAHTVRKIDKNGIITTIAGIGGENGYSGDGNLATKCNLNIPTSVQVTPTGEVFIADKQNFAIRKIFLNGTITTFAGGNGFGMATTGQLAKHAKFADIQSIFYAHWSDELYISDASHYVIWKILSNGTLITVAGIPGSNGYNGNLLPPLQTTLSSPRQVFVTFKEEIYFADQSAHIVRKIFNNTVSIVAGIPHNYNFNGYSGSVTPATAATLSYPGGVFVSEMTDEIYIVDTGNVIIRKITANNTLVTVAGIRNVGQYVSSSYTGDGGIATNAQIGFPVNAALNNKDELFSVDNSFQVVRKVDTNGIISTFAGWSVFNPKTDRQLLSQVIDGPASIQLTADHTLYVLDGGKIKTLQKDRLVDMNLGLVNLVYMYIKESTNELYALDVSRLYKVDLQSKNVTILAGGGNLGFAGDDGPATHAIFQQPSSIYIAKNNDIYIADTYNHCIRKITHSTGFISRVAGIGGLPNYGFNGNDILATDALLYLPTQVLLDEETGELYIADAGNSRMRKVKTDGIIITIAFINTYHFIFDEQKNIIFSNALDSTIEKWYRSNGTIETLIGRKGPVNGFTADGNGPLETKFYNPTYFFFAPNDIVYISDGNNYLIRKISTLCEEYQFSPSFQFYLNNSKLQITTAAEYSCKTNEDRFLEEYLPLLEMNFKSTNNELQTVVSDWGKNVSFEASVSGQYLDIITLTLNGCNEKKGLSANCSTTQEFGILPSSIKTNFYFEPSVTSILFINYFTTSQFVSSFTMKVQLINTNTNQIEKISYYSSPYTTIPINGLQHSTLYSISVMTQVYYSNTINLQSIETNYLISTKIGIVPSASVQQIELITQDTLIILTWETVPINQRGNTDIHQLEIQIKTNSSATAIHSNEEELEILSIPYSATSNSPSFYAYNYTQYNVNYEFRIRVCNEIGCGVFSDPISQYISSPVSTDPIASSNLTGVIASVVIIVIVLLLVLCACLIILVILVIVSMIILQKRKLVTTIHHTAVLDTELLDQMISKDFKIEESKLDFSHSVFIGSGASGSVITAKYFNIDVAIKLIKTNSMGIETEMTDFYNELKFMNQNAHHQNIIRFFGVYQSEEKIGLVMELCSNGSVANYISKLNLNFQSKVKLMQGIANGMRYLHHFNIAHRDLKCENVLLDESLTPKIIDFGFSRQIETNANQSLNLTMNIGTAAYCAPEVLQLQVNSLTVSLDGSTVNENRSNRSMSSEKKLSYDKKCDVYSFGIVIYVIYFQTKNPYGNNVTDTQIMYQLSKNINYRPKFDEEKIPVEEKWLIELMKLCWKTNPEERLSFEQICDVLDGNCE